MSKSNQPVEQGAFVRRHIGPSEAEISAMLAELGVSDIDALIDQTIPVAIRERSPMGVGEAMDEEAVLAHLRGIAAENMPFVSLIGQGYYGTLLPGVIQRNILENPAWYTAYTPYQPEISQGRLEALLNFQTLLCDLTGLDVANASLLDEATAAAEAMALARRSSKVKADRFFVDADCHPQTLAVLRTRAEPLGWEIVVGNPQTNIGVEVFGILLQYPGSSGEVRDFRQVIASAKAKGAVVSMAADPLALTLLTSPGELGADIAIGSMQRYGVPMGYGGPHAAYMAVKDALKRSMPGRLIGVSVDSRGEPAYRLALQTREQHIRREKATSNICTAQVLLAVIASMYAVYHGPEGLKAIALAIHEKTNALAAHLRGLGFEVVTTAAFDTITVKTGADTATVHARAVADGINFRRVDDAHIGVSLDESVTPAVLARVIEAFAAGRDGGTGEDVAIPAALRRSDDILTHPVFHLYRSETEMLRYLRRLSDKDLALDRTMIPLGSCTMKLNATTEMIPITWPEFSNLHPFAPKDQAKGYQRMFDTLEAYLCGISGYDAVSLQPNSGAQGEYAGLLAIRGYHLSRGDAHRDICLIPASAHGTNPASAQMVGMKTVVVACDEDGNVDMADLKIKVDQYAANLAAIMITYPSTHGVFEEAIKEICDLVHAAGGQVYLDGANLNAQVGLSRPGHYGSDVSHFNLHKTFCIPHGGGGPGMGPIGVKAHLKPFLPSDPQTGEAGAVSAAPYGSASILPISFAYMLLMGDQGLRKATEVAILNANYIAARLEGHYPVLYRGEKGRVAHECIIDMRPIKDTTGVTVDDVAKRLIDHGFHAPTMSFPVPGTLMIEPTESEAKTELDRFCDAMIDIKREIDDVANGRLTAEQSPLRHAPHTIFDLAAETWDRVYSRREACFPTRGAMTNKYWSPVNRIDNVYGDRHLVCSCPPMESYLDEAAE
ncbi:aminomethyl-transferring glycine dehydrogenase [Asticcacaulis excentricus]|uniref:Glycine dehydrogenase (decarboxylating) n=1 Tax=Asticcacaulis excentricus (strain ATCC 15261 / DSM 4724 / KCTC 12464 / NCIMB 9791 / VKM B-1370 / CB 48) TaxID=573065 RepID=E8RQC5_ASTEC|nr:aminomethyl-transferring glycine dehydrogenase [Asticcacaulis excentricus]ADU13227.1 glycine dehydrogenase [Asticcacaulis excentricus CB 48]